MRRALITAAAIAVAFSPALATEALPIPPDQAALACQAHATHELEKEGAKGAEPVERFKTEKNESSLVRVTGVFIAEIDGEARKLSVTCDVSSNGVEVFTMEGGNKSN